MGMYSYWQDEMDKFYEEMKVEVARDYGLDPVKDEKQIDEIIADEIMVHTELEPSLEGRHNA